MGQVNCATSLRFFDFVPLSHIFPLPIYIENMLDTLSDKGKQQWEYHVGVLGSVSASKCAKSCKFEIYA